jgi:hypothetical protein
MHEIHILDLTIDVLRNVLNNKYENTNSLCAGSVLEISQALDELIVMYHTISRH